jgi:hypothetical protein
VLELSSSLAASHAESSRIKEEAARLKAEIALHREGKPLQELQVANVLVVALAVVVAVVMAVVIVSKPAFFMKNTMLFLC